MRRIDDTLRTKAAGLSNLGDGARRRLNHAGGLANGRDGITLEFRTRFDQGRYESEGREVKEQLIDERVFRE